MFTKSPDEIQHIVDGLGYDFDHYDLGHFVHYIATRRERRILVQGWELQREMFGIWVPQVTLDLVAYNNVHHPLQQRHAILHEIAHMVLGHPLIPLTELISPEIQAEFKLANSHQGHARTLWSRQNHPDQEFEADWFVFAIQKRVLHHDRVTELYRSGSTVAEFKPYADGMGFED